MRKANIANLKPFKPGQSGNPGGKPVGARNELSAAFLRAVIADFNANGADAITKLRTESPVKYCELIAGLLPSEANVSVKSDHTVTHVTEPVSATAGWVSEALRERADREMPKPLPN
jgi:hypothetical protein